MNNDAQSVPHLDIVRRVFEAIRRAGRDPEKDCIHFLELYPSAREDVKGRKALQHAIFKACGLTYDKTKNRRGPVRTHKPAYLESRKEKVGDNYWNEGLCITPDGIALLRQHTPQLFAPKREDAN